LSGDVLADPRDHIRLPVLEEFASDTRLGFTEAVTQKSFAAGLLLPHWHADVAGAKPIVGVAEVHRFAGRIGAESVVRQPNSSKGDRRQQRFDCLELNRCSAIRAGRAGPGSWFRAGRIATVVHHSRVSTLKCTSESSALIPSEMSS
jgi:hypothetical protein